MRTIKFDTNGVTSSCPISDIGLATISECEECDWFCGLISISEGECEHDEVETEAPDV